MDFEIAVVRHLEPWEEQTVSEGFAAYNTPFVGPGVREPVVLTSYGPFGALLGALDGMLFFDWVSINRLWVEPSSRDSGLGTQLMEKAHAIAQDRGAIGAYLNTFDFQARDFYEKLGYKVFGTLQDCPAGHQRFFMQKRF